MGRLPNSLHDDGDCNNLSESWLRELLLNPNLVDLGCEVNEQRACSRCMFLTYLKDI